MKLYVDEGLGYELKKTVNSGKEISYQYFAQNTTTIGIRVNAIVNGESLESTKEHLIIVYNGTPVVPLPQGMKAGINYDANDDEKVTLVLEAPGKEAAFVVGDFNDWIPNDDYIMNQTPDGEYFWKELNSVIPNKEYIFQYLVDGDVLIADPYADKILDPYNDKYIEEEVYPGLLPYDKEEYGIASVFQTGQEPFAWSQGEQSWQRPNIDHLVIYELHLRDFLKKHSYNALSDTLSYLKNLGIQAIELMPINEFDGNDSWGYNPTFFFAPDKYYGTKDDLKRFVDLAHQQGIAVILDMVLNHSYWQNPFVQLYFDNTASNVTAQNPWFNVENVGPYDWGFDFNHESKYTQNFIDRVNAYWIEEFHIDGYRFDFTKGFTNYAPGGSIDGFDQSRIDIIKRMSDKIWDVDNKAYVILEHWGPAAEENQLAAHGCKLWRNKSYDFVPVAIGNSNGSFSGVEATSHVSFFNSHDERRIAEHCITEGKANGAYNIKNEEIMFERVKMSAAFLLLSPGPKMIWQFDELGYDIDIDFNGRTGRKPFPWGNNSLNYYENDLRQNIYKTYKGLLDVRKKVGASSMMSSIQKIKNTGSTRRYSYDTGNIDLVLLGNFATSTQSVNPEFSIMGTWYDYFSGEEINVTNLTSPISLAAGEWHIYTTVRLTDSLPGVVETYSNPVTISPSPFGINDNITIRFDATKAFPGGTQGLKGSNKVYMHAGLVAGDPHGENLDFEVGNLVDDGVGEMTSLGNDMWEIKLKISDYFDVDNADEIFKIGMWFRDENNVNKGFGFRDKTIYFDVLSTAPFVWVEPSPYNINTVITIKFDARQGNGELVGADKVYIHSGMGTVDTSSPQSSAWNNAVGNWGQDDGVGKMSRVEGETDIWEISLTPKNYYGLNTGVYPYWLAAVFRNANGSKKGTGTPGTIEGGFIDSNYDFFIRNNKPSNTIDIEDELGIVYPNPNYGVLYFKDNITPFTFSIFDMNGKLVFQIQNTDSEMIDISHLYPGTYIYRIDNNIGIKSSKLIISKNR
jgi:glycosidase